MITLYIGLLFLPFLVTFAIRKRLKGFFGFVLCITLSSLLMITPVITVWMGSNYYLEQEIAKLDRDGDGFWSDDEQLTWTGEDRANLDRHIGDGGRNVFSAIIFPIFSACYSLIIVSTWWLVLYLKRRGSVQTAPNKLM